MSAPPFVWYEDYHCGCVSRNETRRGLLLGYCAKHGDSRRKLFKVSNEPKKAAMDIEEIRYRIEELEKRK